ncbi:T6SS immunity protein Tli3 family protein [Tenebrionibacter intestinalis]|jgi:hypothetical protein|uniref:Tli3-like domain-containing protein n=1 Tax=Tenebrionibacter intestinalis TaxID=2799638 RepID=A0A8K0VA85_9ENTR|nr:hypothetical protein [Tenebrionibacter intestinalis]MBK4717070.1 hypothetical protein [Tenebrionibacter intestinalis]
MKNKTLIIISLCCVLFIVITIIIANLPSVGRSFGYGMPGPARKDNDRRVVRTNAPPQVIYRLDDHRYLTLENYIACDKSGQVYYHDSQLGIKTRLEAFSRDGWSDDGKTRIKNQYAGDDQIQLKDVENSFMHFKGKLINNATNGVLVFPFVNNRWQGCSNNHGCYQTVLVSTDKGRTFFESTYDRSTSHPNIRTTFIIENDYYIRADGYGEYIKVVPYSDEKNVSNQYIGREGVMKIERMNGVGFFCDENIKPSKVKFIKPEKE